jgi:hypothetical protein
MVKIGHPAAKIIVTGLTLTGLEIADRIIRSRRKKKIVDTNEQIAQTFDNLRTAAVAVHHDHEAAGVLIRIDRIIAEWERQQAEKND